MRCASAGLTPAPRGWTRLRTLGGSPSGRVRSSAKRACWTADGCTSMRGGVGEVARDSVRAASVEPHDAVTTASMTATSELAQMRQLTVVEAIIGRPDPMASPRLERFAKGDGEGGGVADDARRAVDGAAEVPRDVPARAARAWPDEFVVADAHRRFVAMALNYPEDACGAEALVYVVDSGAAAEAGRRGRRR